MRTKIDLVLVRLRTTVDLVLPRLKTTIDLVFVRPIKYFIRFLGPVSALSIGLLCVAGLALLWTWQHEDWRPYVSATAGGAGVLLAAVPALIHEAEKPARWILATAGGAFTTLFAWYTTADLTEQLKAKQEEKDQLSIRLILAKSDLVEYVKPLTPVELRRLLTEAGIKLRDRFSDAIKTKPPFRPRIFDPSRDVAELIKSLDGNNGHFHYISGEIDRASGDRDSGHQRFYAYLEAENGRTRNGTIGGEACRSPEGFCRERTAWIFHRLANDLFERASALKKAGRPAHEYKQLFLTALKHTCSAIQLFPPDGFIQPRPERDLEKSLFDELSEGCPPTTG